ncbi:hypothetical protein NST07_18315 [Paenibacillus sp. FSL L8-0340]|uniref:hypothetical protein n=1 Tax=Paenibacillus sp. FSL L8-0340 TaxID=2954685 RepID=UPI0031587DFB
MGTGGFFEVTAGILSAQIKVTYVNLPQNPEKSSFFHENPQQRLQLSEKQQKHGLPTCGGNPCLRMFLR